jgi:hypothetical protein
MIAYLMPIVLQWLWDTLTLFNADKTGNPLVLVALLGRLFLIALIILVPMGAATEVNHRWRRRARA